MRFEEHYGVVQLAGYGSATDDGFAVKYRARCHCGAVRYDVSADPVDAKICHCRACQVLHGAPMQWAAIFHKRDVRLVAARQDLRFYDGELAVGEFLLGTDNARLDVDVVHRYLAFRSYWAKGIQRATVDRAVEHAFYEKHGWTRTDGGGRWMEIVRSYSSTQ